MNAIMQDQFEVGRDAVARPQPLALMAELGKQSEYPTWALGPVLSAAAIATAAHAYVPMSIAAQSIITACSLAVQAHFDVVLPTGQVRPTSLFAVTVAESGDRKSTSDDFVMQPVWAYQEMLEAEYEAKKADSLMAQSAWDETKKDVTNRLKKSGKEALQDGYRDLGPRPDGPIDPTIVIRSGTTQGLLKRFIISRPSLGLMSDEGGSWLGGFGMTEDNRLMTISTLSDFWDGKTVQMNTGGEGFTALRGCRLTFHLMIQPVLSGRLLGNAEAQGQGFLSRLLVSHPESIAGTRFVHEGDRDKPEHAAAIDAYRTRLSQIIAASLPYKPDTTLLDLRPLHMSAKAKEMWWAFYNSIEARLGPDGDLNQVKGFVGKLPEQAARLAANVGVFHRGIRIEEIDTEMLAAGIALAEFYLSEAVRLFGQAPPSSIVADAQELSDWLSTKWKENLISITTILQFGPKQVRQGGDYVRELLDTLVRHEHVAENPGGGMVSGKKVREAWRVIIGRG